MIRTIKLMIKLYSKVSLRHCGSCSLLQFPKFPLNRRSEPPIAAKFRYVRSQLAQIMHDELMLQKSSGFGPVPEAALGHRPSQDLRHKSGQQRADHLPQPDSDQCSLCLKQYVRSIFSACRAENLRGGPWLAAREGSRFRSLQHRQLHRETFEKSFGHHGAS